MGRLKVTPAGKRRKTRPITRIGKKSYLRRRFLAENREQVAGHNNEHSRDIMFRDGEHATAFQHYTRSGFSMDPSATIGLNAKATANRAIVTERLKKIKRRKLKAQKEQEKKEAEERAELEQLAAQGKKKETKARAMEHNEGALICNLLLKYGTQFKRMALDVRMNPFQLTPAQLQKKCANFLKLQRDAFPEQFEEMRAMGLVQDPAEILGKDRRRRPEDVADRGGEF